MQSLDAAMAPFSFVQPGEEGQKAVLSSFRNKLHLYIVERNILQLVGVDCL